MAKRRRLGEAVAFFPATRRNKKGWQAVACHPFLLTIPTDQSNRLETERSLLMRSMASAIRRAMES
jgi:hypothetical protein